jgi:putative tricarboxylic transport membrane protein
MRLSERLARAELWLAVGVIAVGAFLFFQTAAISVSPSYARVGPRVFPWAVSSVLVLLGVALAVQALSGRWTSAPEPLPDRGAWSPLWWILAGLTLFVATISWAGFPIAAALLFIGAARGFDSRSLLLDVVLGFGLGLAVFIGFQRGLGLSLPAGLLEGLI